MDDLMDDELGDPVTVFNYKGSRSHIDHDDADLTAVIGIDGPRRVEQGHPVLQGETAARPYLGLIPCRQGNGNAGGDKQPLPGGKGDLFFQ